MIAIAICHEKRCAHKPFHESQAQLSRVCLARVLVHKDVFINSQSCSFNIDCEALSVSFWNEGVQDFGASQSHGSGTGLASRRGSAATANISGRNHMDHLPVNVDSTTSFIDSISAFHSVGFLFGSIVQAFLNEVIAPREPFQEVLVFDIIHGNMKMLVATDEWNIILEVPIKD